MPLPLLDQRQQQRDDPDAEQEHADGVEVLPGSRSRLAGGAGCSRKPSSDRDDADRHVDAEDASASPRRAPNSLMSRPPSSGPTAVDRPIVAPSSPKARPRSSAAEQLLDQAGDLRVDEAAGRPPARAGRRPAQGASGPARRRALDAVNSGEPEQERVAPAAGVAEAAGRAPAPARTPARSRTAPTAGRSGSAPRPARIEGSATLTMLTSSRRHERRDEADGSACQRRGSRALRSASPRPGSARRRPVGRGRQRARVTVSTCPVRLTPAGPSTLSRRRR